LMKDKKMIFNQRNKIILNCIPFKTKVIRLYKRIRW
jgi:hypothetical protein